MAYTTPATWSVGESPTAAKMNTHIRDNIAYLHDSIPTTSLVTSGATAIPNNTWTTIGFDAEIVDEGSQHDTATANSRITFAANGRYLLIATASFVSATNSVALGARFVVDGTTAFSQSLVPGCSQDYNGPSITAIVNQGTSNYVELQVYQNSGGALNTMSSVPGISFGATRLT